MGVLVIVAVTGRVAAVVDAASRHNAVPAARLAVATNARLMNFENTLVPSAEITKVEARGGSERGGVDEADLNWMKNRTTGKDCRTD